MIFRSPYPPLNVPRVTLHDFVLGGAAARGDAPALVEGTTGRVLTYAQLAEQTRRFAAGLSRAGIRQGHVVAIWSAELARVRRGVPRGVAAGRHPDDD